MPYLCVDDFGSEVYLCAISGAIIVASETVFMGATLPGVKARYSIHNTHNVLAQWKQQIRHFHEAEANCNTCKTLIREKHPRNGGFLKGRCSLAGSSKLHYSVVGEVFWFHPDDPMHMECHKPRTLPD